MSTERFRLELRLRKFLKNALRGYGLRAIEIGSHPVIESDTERRERLRQQAIEIDREWNERNGF